MGVSVVACFISAPSVFFSYVVCHGFKPQALPPLPYKQIIIDTRSPPPLLPPTDIMTTSTSSPPLQYIPIDPLFPSLSKQTSSTRACTPSPCRVCSQTLSLTSSQTARYSTDRVTSPRDSTSDMEYSPFLAFRLVLAGVNSYTKHGI